MAKKKTDKTDVVAGLAAGREIVHPQPTAKFFLGEKGITPTVAKKLLGWVEENEGGEKFGTDFLLKDRLGRKIRCENNIRNRPLYMSSVEEYVQDMLQQHWMLNGEPIIIGKSGIVLNGQHQLISVVLAEQDRVADEHWKDIPPISIDKLVVYGVDETDDVINTMDTCKPRSLADVLYRSEFFAKVSSEIRRIAARATENAVRNLWVRTGVYLDAYSKRRTHSEAISFIEGHKRLLKCIRHVIDENKEGKITNFVSLGYAAAAMYLMASSDSAAEKYYATEDHTERPLDWSKWDTAAKFWVDFVADGGPLEKLREAIAKLGDEAKQSQKDYLICAAWRLYSTGKKVKDLSISWSDPDDKGAVHMIDIPDFGGIDLGASKEKRPLEDENPEPSDIEKRTEEVRKEKEGTKREPKPIHEELHEQHPDCTLMFVQNSLKKWVAWGDDAEKVAAVTGEKPKMHPSGIRNLSYKDEEIEDLANRMVDAGNVVGVAARTSDGSYLTSVIRAGAPKSRK